jgi:MFS family permease
LTTAVVARLPQAMSSLAIVRLVRDQDGSYALASALTALFVAVGVVGQPLLARLVDTTGRSRTVLLSSAVVSSLALVGLALTAVTIPALGVVLTILAGVASPPVESCLRSLWARMMTPGKQLHSAFSFDAAAQEILFIAGPLVTALGIIAFGAQGNMFLMAGLGLAGTIAFASHSRLAYRQPAIARNSIDHHRGLLLRLPALRQLVIVQFTVGVPVGVLTISATAYGELVGATSVGAWGLAVNAGGALIGAIVIARRPLATPPHRAIRWLLLALGVLYLPTALALLPVAAWLVAALLAGLMLSPLLTQVFTQTELVSPSERLNEANAWVVSAMTVGIAFGTIVAGLIVAASPGAGGIAVMVIVGSAVAIVGSVFASPKTLSHLARSDV